MGTENSTFDIIYNEISSLDLLDLPVHDYLQEMYMVRYTLNNIFKETYIHPS